MMNDIIQSLVSIREQISTMNKFKGQKVIVKSIGRDVQYLYKYKQCNEIVSIGEKLLTKWEEVLNGIGKVEVKQVQKKIWRG
jgi:hypothetical protein